jgi:hypothetical protein
MLTMVVLTKAQVKAASDHVLKNVMQQKNQSYVVQVLAHEGINDRRDLLTQLYDEYKVLQYVNGNGNEYTLPLDQQS